jgi:hypothetical protein
MAQLTVVASSIPDFFSKLIGVQSALRPDDAQLTPTEIKFLAECCYLYHEGYNLSEFKVLYRHFVTERKMFKRKTDVSLYKNKLASKKWIRGGANIFELPVGLTKMVKDGNSFKFDLGIYHAESTETPQ